MTAHEEFLHRELAIKDKKIDELKAKVVALEKAIEIRKEAMDEVFIAIKKRIFHDHY